MRDEFRAKFPAKTFGELSKHTSEQYKLLSPEERAKWNDIANKDKERYEKEMANYIPPEGYDTNGVMIGSKGPSPRKYTRKELDPDAPKRSRSAYVFFTIEMRPQILQEFPEIKFTDVGHIMGERWRALTPEEKKRFDDLAAEDKKRFNAEMDEYNAKKAKMESEMNEHNAKAGTHMSPHKTAYQAASPHQHSPAQHGYQMQSPPTEQYDYTYYQAHSANRASANTEYQQYQNDYYAAQQQQRYEQSPPRYQFHQQQMPHAQQMPHERHEHLPHEQRHMPHEQQMMSPERRMPREQEHGYGWG